MMRALFAAISGLRNHQLFMDTVGNNLANVNTTGYKASRMTFSDLLSQTISSGSAPSGGLGSINSKQIGLGGQIASIDILQLQGSLQSTGKSTDLAIQGDGFFVLSNGSRQLYTRDGAFDIASDGSLVNPASGMKVQGWQADATGTISTTGPVESLNIPIGQQTVASETGSATFTGNLNATEDHLEVPAPTATAGLTVVDSQGRAHTITITFTKTNVNEWTWSASESDTSITSVTTGGDTVITFDANGAFDPANTASTLDIDFDAAVTGAADITGLTLDFGDLSQLAANSEVAMSSQDGFVSGTLVAFRLGAQGEVVGIYTNGLTRNLAQLSLANFVNPGGLTRGGNNLFEESGSSGAPLIGTPGAGGRGIASSGNLESSNVDLSREFTNMIIGQRGFQANARVVTTSDEMLNDLVNLRR